MQAELQNLICRLLLFLFPGGTKGQMKRGQGPDKSLAAEKLPWHAVSGAGTTLSRQEAQAPGWPLRSPGGMQST